MDKENTAVYYDRDGDEIDLSVISSVYVSKKQLLYFFHNFTNYGEDEIPSIIDDVLANVTPKQYTPSERAKMKKQIEEGFGIRSIAPDFERDMCGLLAWIIGLGYALYGVYRILTFDPNSANALNAVVSSISLVFIIPNAVLCFIAAALGFVGWFKSTSGPMLAAAILFTIATIGAMSLTFWILLLATIAAYVSHANLKKR